MPKSMTGFGRAALDTSKGKFSVEVQSVNRKHFEAVIFLPKELLGFENDIRKLISEKVSRGQITVRVQLVSSKGGDGYLLPDLEVLKRVKGNLEHLSKELGLDAKKIDLPFLFDLLSSVPKTETVQEDFIPLQKCVNLALDAFSSMRIQEGKVLVEDVRNRMETIQKMVSSIAQFSSDATEKMRRKLLEKMTSLLPKDADLDERIIREVAFFAEKVDIAEELIRLESHFAQFEECLQSHGSVGRKMDFVIQEISREINTIGSKSCEAKISYLIVDIKSEIEKVREQVQNIE